MYEPATSPGQVERERNAGSMQAPSAGLDARACIQRGIDAVARIAVLASASWMCWVVAGAGLVRAVHADLLLAGTFALIGASSIVMLIVESVRRPYSLALAHWVFCFIFFFVSPLAQFDHDDFSWGHVFSADVPLLLETNLFVLIWISCWVIITLPRPAQHESPNRDQNRLVHFTPAMSRYTLLLLASLAVLLLQAQRRGFSGLFARGATEGLDASGSSLSLIIDTFGRGIPVALCLLALMARRRDPRFTWTALFALASALSILNNFPTMTPRYWTAALAFGFAAHLGWLVKRWRFPAAILVGMVFIFPLLGASRHATTLSQTVQSAGQASGVAQAFQAGDYDAYAMVAHAIQYLASYGDTGGKQLLTAAFFFVPRTMWPGKSVGSGSTIAEHFNFAITNVSCPLPAEGLMNFGLVGLVAFAAVSALLARKLDQDFWSGATGKLYFLYPFLPGLFFFMMRGDMLSSTAYTVGFTCALMLGFSGLRRAKTRGPDGPPRYKDASALVDSQVRMQPTDPHA